jgi:hypothetical protein
LHSWPIVSDAFTSIEKLLGFFLKIFFLIKKKYLHAKEELMWILLQYIAHAKSKESQRYAVIQQQPQQQQLQQVQQIGNFGSSSGPPSNRELVLEIFNVLYADKSMNWGNSCSTDRPLQMVN